MLGRDSMPDSDEDVGLFRCRCGKKYTNQAQLSRHENKCTYLEEHTKDLSKRGASIWAKQRRSGRPNDRREMFLNREHTQSGGSYIPEAGPVPDEDSVQPGSSSIHVLPCVLISMYQSYSSARKAPSKTRRSIM